MRERTDPSVVQVRILIADGSEAARKELRRILEQRRDWQVCGEASTGRQTVDLALRLRPDVAVLDLAVPEMNGLEATRRIKKALPGTEILLLTTHEAEDLTRDILGTGARGYLLRCDAAKEISAAVEALSQHKPYLTWKATRAVLVAYLEHGTSKTSQARPSHLLTAREREVLQLLAEGRSNNTISTLLLISVKTVETHRAAIMKKLDLRSLAELVRYAIRNHVIDGA
ncbi:MAG: response regulator [Stellaceae bacterium]